MTGDTHRWWSHMQEQSRTPISKLVEDFDAIATQAIPYAQLPKRAATVYSDELRCWSDLADATIHSLTEWPKSGVATVRALVGAARDASAKAGSDTDENHDALSAAGRLLAALTERDRKILDTRLWARHPLTRHALADQLGKNGTWIYRHQPRVEARFAELCANPLHRDLIGHAGQLRLRIGAVAREHTLTAALAEIGLDEESQAGRMLLYLAGPYQRAAAEGWWENNSTGGWARAVKAVDAVFARGPAPERSAFMNALAKAGVQRELADDVVDSQPGLRRFGDKWVRWGNSIADKAAAILHVDSTHTPVTSDVIAAAIGENHHERAVSQALFGDRRFARASRQMWALGEWGLPEYSGVFHEIAQRVDSAGGSITIAELVRDITTTFPDVAEASVRTYISTQAFIVEDNTVRRRTTTDSWREVSPLNKARGAFRNGTNRIRLAIPVTHDVLRGSGQPIHPAVADALGVIPGQQRRFTGVIDIVIRWQLSSARGPSVGTLRPLTTALEAVEGDELVLVLNSKSATFDIGRIAADDNLHQRLQMLIARPSPNPLSAIATSLSCQPTEVITLLRQRGDTDLADLLDQEADRCK
ncbi:hypothetical protein [Mycobacterium sp.]|uniref:hypothetical protein n=1 Tax=Mycobacterium sp. TaxID=1785 RepID=UPI0031D2A840